MENGLAHYLALEMDEATRLLELAFDTYRRNLLYLSDPTPMARSGLYLALAHLAVGRQAAAREVVQQLVRFELDKELREKEDFPPSLLEVLESIRQEEEARPTVTLQLESRPQGAVIYLDGAFRGRTPWRSGALFPGTHGLRLEKPGYVPIFRTVELERGAEPMIRLNVGILPGRPEGGVTRLLELRHLGGCIEEQEEEILRQAEDVGAAATVLGFFRPRPGRSPEWSVLIGLYRSERARVLGIRELTFSAGGELETMLAGLGSWVTGALDEAPAPPSPKMRKAFYRCSPTGSDLSSLTIWPWAAEPGSGPMAPSPGSEHAGLPEAEAAENVPGKPSAPNRFSLFLGAGSGVGWVEQQDGSKTAFTPIVLDAQVHFLLRGPLALGLAVRGQPQGAVFLAEPQLRYQQERGELALHMYCGLPVGEIAHDLPREEGTEGGGEQDDARSGWAGMALGAGVFWSATPHLALGLQARMAMLFPSFAAQLDRLWVMTQA